MARELAEVRWLAVRKGKRRKDGRQRKRDKGGKEAEADPRSL
jgi:hypothetical protein